MRGDTARCGHQWQHDHVHWLPHCLSVSAHCSVSSCVLARHISRTRTVAQVMSLSFHHMFMFMWAFLLALLFPFYFTHFLPHSFHFLLHLKFVDNLRIPHKREYGLVWRVPPLHRSLVSDPFITCHSPSTFSLVFSCWLVLRFRNSRFALSNSRINIREVTDCVSLGFNRQRTLSVSLFPSRDIVTLWPSFGWVRKLSRWFKENVYHFVVSCLPLRRHRLASRATTAVNCTLIFPMKPLSWTSPMAPRSCPFSPLSVTFVVCSGGSPNCSCEHHTSHVKFS